MELYKIKQITQNLKRIKEKKHQNNQKIYLSKIKRLSKIINKNIKNKQKKLNNNINLKFKIEKQRNTNQKYQIKIITQNKQITTNSLRAQKLRNEENVTSYLKYKQFLDKLPPKQWIEEQMKIKAQKIKEIKQKYIHQWLKQETKQQDPKKSKKVESPTQKMRQVNRRFQQLMKKQEIQEIQELHNQQEMYFKEPHELIQYFNNLQQANLFCMQQAQRAMQSFQTLKTHFYEKKAALQIKYKLLTEHKSSLQKQLSEMETSIKGMKKKKQLNTSNISQKDNKDLKTIIINQYLVIKQTMPSLLPEVQGNNPQPLVLLSSIEISMQKLLDKLIEASNEQPRLIKEIKNALQKKKNIEKRQEAALLNKQEQQKRKSRNLNKKQAINKTIGRIDMMRSAPNDKQINQKVQIVDNKDDSDKKYLIQ